MNQPFPKISVITPSYNQGRFLEETILSVIGQGYPNLEYIIMDGGSTDNSVEIIKKYEKHLAYWVSEKDKGQSDAINKGFRVATGDLLAWLNSDDLYFPGSLFVFAAEYRKKGRGIFFGNCIHFKNDNKGLASWGSNVLESAATASLQNLDYIIQPSSFWTRDVLEQAGPLSQEIHFAFDWEWFLRAEADKIPFHGMNNVLSLYRIHEEHKSGTGGDKRRVEIQAIYDRFSPRYASLYRLINNEYISISTTSRRLYGLLLRLAGKDYSYFAILKRVKPGKFKDYSVLEIRNCYSML